MQDKTGPMGMGSGTGRGMGSCGAKPEGGLGRGRGYGRVMCGWFWRKYRAMPKDEKKEILQAEVEDLKQEMEMVKSELKELGK